MFARITETKEIGFSSFRLYNTIYKCYGYKKNKNNKTRKTTTDKSFIECKQVKRVKISKHTLPVLTETIYMKFPIKIFKPELNFEIL